MRVCQLKVITSIDHRDRTLQDFYADLELVAVRCHFENHRAVGMDRNQMSCQNRKRGASARLLPQLLV